MSRSCRPIRMCIMLGALAGALASGSGLWAEGEEAAATQARLQLLRELTALDGPPGFESPVARVVGKALADLGEITRDGLGCVICTRQGTAKQPRVMLAAHMDEVGLMVRYVAEDGSLKLCALGAWSPAVLPAQQLRVLTRKGTLLGVVGSLPPHVAGAEEAPKLADLWLDIGAADKAQAEEWGVRPGDLVMPEAGFTQLAEPQMVMARALDNRAGVAMMIEAMRALARTGHPNTLCAVGTVREEEEAIGAITASRLVNPDVAIVLDVDLAGDTPGMTPEDSQSVMGGGPVISLREYGLNTNRHLRDLVIDTCEELKLPYQLSVVDSGTTDAFRITANGRGVPAVVIGPPVRYVHTPRSLMSLRDYEQCLQLVIALCRRLDRKAVDALAAD